MSNMSNVTVNEASAHKLTPAQLERLAWLSEGAGELQQAIGKILRHGYASVNPHVPEKGNNRQQLNKEISHVLLAVSTLYFNGDISTEDIVRYKDAKRAEIDQYLHYYHAMPLDTGILW